MLREARDLFMTFSDLEAEGVYLLLDQRQDQGFSYDESFIFAVRQINLTYRAERRLRAA